MNIDRLKNFNKPPESYWIASTETTNYPTLNQDINVDILIVGGGFVGFACAYKLIEEGFKIAILEGNRILNGVTAYTTAKITSQHELIYKKLQKQMGIELAQQYADANQYAIKEIKRIAEKHNIECDYVPESAFAFTQQDKYIQKIEDEVKIATDLGIKATFVDEIPFNLPIKAAVRFDDQARFHPRKFTLGLAKYIEEKGVQIYENSRAVDIEEDNNGYIVTTDQGKKVTAKKVIIATHYPFYNKHGMYFSRIYVERAYVLAIQVKEKYPGGMYINIDDPARSLRNQKAENGELILVIGDHHKTGQGRSMVKHYKALVDFANNLFTVENIPYRWSTQDCMTLDGIPYVGNFTSNTPNLYIATGFQKWGMTNSIVASLLIKDLIIHGESPWEDVYNPSRKTIIASAKTFIVENYNVAEQLIDGKLEQLPKEADLKPGDAKVLKIDGKRVGAYRDRQGELHLVNTTCTHMGCELNWNSAEESWDCPCHGSRFTYEGKIISGPAVNPLKAINDVNTIKKLFSEDF
ncbi:MAG: FAD-dependent oxidoreductase [Clostridiales bacterium]|jgi:glycine/D-amino acid oxidase-like deaminating enzyme/nitrite reductase/ring-hydroxylating ferredoxin subunit|nr:FAD-dependent oxidoreductase [Clostridiales bacterium]